MSSNNEISDWAVNEVYSIVGYGIMSVTDGRFNPKGTMTRAEVANAFAAMLRTIENL